MFVNGLKRLVYPIETFIKNQETMKKLFTILCFLMFTVTVSAKSQPTQKTTFNETITHINDDFDADIVVQDLRSVAERSENYQDSKGYFVYKNESYRYSSGITSSGYGTDIQTDKSTIGNTKCSTIKNSQNITQENRKHYQSGLFLSRIGNGSEDLRENNNTSTASNHQSAGNNYNFTKTDTSNTETFYLRRYSFSSVDWDTDCDSFFQKAENRIKRLKYIENLPQPKSKYHG